ncbi:hypothetical protein PQ459_06730 [Chryseobacterium sp. KACC 21268]|nr:hypothetical protein PQ459_06730 [Chryseobacterium sp. KACC 21268]
MKKTTLLFILFSGMVFSQTTAELQKLKDFAKAYGIVRYFHPSDEASQINWNYFASYGIEQISKAKDQKEFEGTLKNIFSPIAPSVTFNEKKYVWNDKNLVPVFWIHQGLGIDVVKEKSIYSSKRSNRAESSRKIFNFVSLTMNPEKIDSQIKITYEAKSTNDTESFVYTNVYNAGNEKPNFKTHQHEPVTSNNWEKKELLIDNDKSVSKINIGLMSSKGGSEFQNLKLLYLNDKNEWISYNLPGFTDVNWKANKPTNQTERSDSVLKIVNKSNANADSHTIDWDKYLTINLSNNFNLNVPTVVYSDEKSTLPISDKLKFDELKSQLKSGKFNRNIALANVIISWNIFKHFYPYQDVVKTDWDKVLEEALKDAYDDQNEDDNYLTLKKFTSNFDDGHMSVFNKSVNDKNKFAPGIALRFLNNELIVKSVALGIVGVEKGDIITKINGTETQKVIADLQQYISGSKQYRNWLAPQSLLRAAENSTITLTLKNNKEIIVKRDREYSQNFDFYTREDVTKSKEINPETYYVNMDKLSAEEMEAEIPTIRKYKKFNY